jgi:hypothetical protein
MSKKTRKQKLAAELRRKSQSQNPSNEIKINIEDLKIPEKPQKEQYQKESLYVYPVQLVRKDLTKTLILSILAISLELALFFLLEKHISLPFIN